MTKEENFIIVIPARYKSSRFPGKPLALINNKAMIEYIWEICLLVTNKKNIIVATDHKKIFNFCNAKNINTIMTSPLCLTGTDRVAEVAKKIKRNQYINVQGDEPLINPADIKRVINISKKFPDWIINGMCKITNIEDYKSYDVPKVTFDKNKNLLYMSRASIPASKNKKFIKAYKQVCIYSFPRKSLVKYTANKSKTFFENIEDIEILRFLEMGIKVKMAEVSSSTIAVDRPKDILRVEKYLEDK